VTGSRLSMEAATNAGDPQTAQLPVVEISPGNRFNNCVGLVLGLSRRARCHSSESSPKRGSTLLLGYRAAITFSSPIQSPVLTPVIDETTRHAE
jgi:hypothetical protein